MNRSPVARLIRGWVDLYTRGVTAAVGAARRDEIDDDLWCQHEEAAAVGRSPESLAAEMVVRLLLGMPADLSWRFSHGGRAVASSSERSSSVSLRVFGTAAIIAGASWAFLMIRLLGSGAEAAWTGPDATANTFLGAGGAVAFVVAAVGLAWRFQDRVGSASGLGAALAALGGLIGAAGGGGATALLPIGSAMLMWDLARAGVVSRGQSVIHAATGVAFLVVLVGIIVDYPATMANGALVALALPYMLSWMAIGASLIRGVPRMHEPAPGA